MRYQRHVEVPSDYRFVFLRAVEKPYRRLVPFLMITGVFMALSGAAIAPVRAEARKPNIVIIWGDDIGQSNISA
jgi:hypothetical protein